MSASYRSPIVLTVWGESIQLQISDGLHQRKLRLIEGNAKSLRRKSNLLKNFCGIELFEKNIKNNLFSFLYDNTV